MGQMSWRLLDNEDLDLYEYLALGELLTQRVNTGKSPNTVIFFVSGKCVIYNDSSALGHINMEECRKQDIPILKGITNGGALYLDESVLRISVVYKTNETVDTARVRGMKSIMDACAEIGLKAEISKYSPRSNDVVINGKKVSGVAFQKTGNSMRGLFTLLLDFDYETATKVLNIPQSKFTDKPYETMNEWLTTINNELGRTLPMEELKTALFKAFEKEYGILEKGGLTDEEGDLVSSLRVKYASDDWKYGKWSPIKDYWRPK